MNAHLVEVHPIATPLRRLQHELRNTWFIIGTSRKSERLISTAREHEFTGSRNRIANKNLFLRDHKYRVLVGTKHVAREVHRIISNREVWRIDVIIDVAHAQPIFVPSSCRRGILRDCQKEIRSASTTALVGHGEKAIASLVVHDFGVEHEGRCAHLAPESIGVFDLVLKDELTRMGIAGDAAIHDLDHVIRPGGEIWIGGCPSGRPHACKPDVTTLGSGVHWWRNRPEFWIPYGRNRRIGLHHGVRQIRLGEIQRRPSGGSGASCRKKRRGLAIISC